jgi:endonuclease I
VNEKPGLYELHRNAAIEELQGNRNPLIDFPNVASKVDFRVGLA